VTVSNEELLMGDGWSTDAVGHEKTLLPDPARTSRDYLVISVDDHIIEPPDMFEGRISEDLADRAPRIIENDFGGQSWIYDGQELPQIGLAAVAGLPVEQWNSDPTRFDQMRTGVYDIHARVHDMDLDGIYASVNFPSHLTGFAGARLQTSTKDLHLALACVRAYNAWHLEDWTGPYPDRIIPCQIPWLHDTELGAAEIRRNAELGFKAISFPEDPAKVGFPSIYTKHWDPIFQACSETETVLCLHAGSSGLPLHAQGAPVDAYVTHFGTMAVVAAIDWLFSLIPVRFPELKIALSEGGIGWVVPLLDRLAHNQRIGYLHAYKGLDVSPSEVLLRNFYFCALDDPSSIDEIQRIGPDHVTVEVDYPHPDSTWPRTQALLRAQLDGFPSDLVQSVTWESAAKLFRHPVPERVRSNFDAF
jgi:predicted TIM-barrel fold metal-dependent hydrolase